VILIGLYFVIRGGAIYGLLNRDRSEGLLSLFLKRDERQFNVLKHAQTFKIVEHAENDWVLRILFAGDVRLQERPTTR
jgi:hypothetical protein